ncbi:MAG: FAD:protein FMN transferase [Bacteroidota bacterium]
MKTNFTVLPMKEFSKFFVIATTALWLYSCNDSSKKRHEINGFTQGGKYHIAYLADDTSKINEDVDSILNSIETTFSIFNPNSFISKLNDTGINEMKVPPMFAEVYTLAKEVTELSGGAFDITVGPLVNAWGFGFKKGIRPDSTKVDSLLNLVGSNHVTFQKNILTKKIKGVRIDMNAIVQGFTCDKLAEYFIQKKITDFVIEIGGEVRAAGKKETGQLWKVGIERPSENESERELETTVLLDNRSLATSGSYRKFFVENGIKYSHTIDPSTGYPVRHSLLSVTVLAPTCAQADAWATAFMVMGKEKAMTFLKNKGKGLQLEALFITAEPDGKMKTEGTEEFQKIIAGSK